MPRRPLPWVERPGLAPAGRLELSRKPPISRRRASAGPQPDVWQRLPALHERDLLASTANRLCKPDSKLEVWDLRLQRAYLLARGGSKLYRVYEPMDFPHRNAGSVEDAAFNARSSCRAFTRSNHSCNRYGTRIFQAVSMGGSKYFGDPDI